MSKLKHAGLTEQILRCSFEVHSQLGAGFLEKVYENSLAIELRASGLIVEQQKPLSVNYKRHVVGEYFADIVVNDLVVIELKAIDKLLDVHEIQLKNYLCATGIEIGLLLNFGKTVHVRRKFVECLSGKS